jgi:hypothetical protein
VAVGTVLTSHGSKASYTRHAPPPSFTSPANPALETGDPVREVEIVVSTHRLRDGHRTAGIFDIPNSDSKRRAKVSAVRP